MPDIFKLKKTDIVSTEKKEGEKYSADEIRHITVDQPFLISGDYFRERTQKPVRLSELLSKKEEQGSTPELKNSAVQESKKIELLSKKEEQESTSELKNSAVQESKKIELLSKKEESTLELKNSAVQESKKIKPVPEPARSQIPEFQNPSSPKQPADSQISRPFPVKVGFILDYDNITAETAEQIMRSIPKAAETLPVVFPDQEMINEVLANTDCLKKRDLFCISGAVRVYPGVRMLALIELFDIPKELPGSATVKIAVVDTGLMFMYPLIEITAQIKNKEDVNSFILGVIDNIAEFAHKKSEIMPWFCRSFSAENEDWYISAGKISGLKLGDKLNVVPEGKLVKSPAGLPAGWMPGTSKGTLEVKQMFGKDFAACSLIQGKGPAPEDMLMPESATSAMP
ncbi:MAG: hypothetical protein GY795_39010 [Desulfobacterales bacterium]|nr:hypothetical protein [Desulfobacterales bacterium]